jgi:hypothetical protein
MKPPFRISQIKWLPYLKSNVPIHEGLVCKDFFVILHSKLSGLHIQTNMRYWNDSKEFRDEFGHIDNKYWKVTAFAELPTLDDSDEFDFATACELMKDGVECESLVDGRVIFIDEGVFKTNDHNNTFPIQLWSDQILGKWRQA